MMFRSLKLTSTSEGLICICLITSGVIIIESDAGGANEGAYLMHRALVTVINHAFIIYGYIYLCIELLKRQEMRFI